MAKKRLGKAHIIMFATVFSLLAFCRVQASVFDAPTVVDLINADRAEQQTKPLKIDNDLSSAAKEKAYDMFARNYFAHNAPDGTTPWQWFDKNGYDYKYAGENLAINFTDAQSQHTALMASESHKKNILNAKYQDVGVAVVSGTMDGRQTIITVQEFGTRVGAVPVGGGSTTPDAAPGQTTPASGAVQKTTQAAGVIVGGLAQSATAALQSRVGSTYTYEIVAVLCAAVFILVFLAGHAHALARRFSQWQAKIKRRLFDVNERYPHHAVCNFVNSIHLGKIYLTHMKMRK